MLSHYIKLLLAPIALYSLEDGWHQVVDAPLTTQEYADQLSDDWVDATDIRAVLDRLDTEQSWVVEEAVLNEAELGREILISMLQKLGWSIAEWDMDWVFQQKWASGRLVFDDYAWFGWSETSVLSTSIVERIVNQVWLTEDEIISALWMWNEQYAQMIANMLIAGQAQRGPNPEQVADMNAMQAQREFMAAEDLIMSQEIPSPDINDTVEPVVAETPTVNPHPDIVESVDEVDVATENISEATSHMLSLLENGEWRVRFSEIKWNSESTTSVQASLIEKVWIEKIKDILGRTDMTVDKFTDWEYWNWTRTVVSEYQRDNGLGVDWAAGTQTIASLTWLEYDNTTRLATLPSVDDRVYASNDWVVENNAI